ncbi:hypothetical protein CE91St14_00340 [Porphyromonas somerae]|nr:hypothetical protein CE91St14_00340 [Porphyromonas somerae]
MVSSESLETLPADYFYVGFIGEGGAMPRAPISDESDESDESDKSNRTPVRVPFS